MRVTNGFEFFGDESVDDVFARRQREIEDGILRLGRDDVLDADRSELQEMLVQLCTLVERVRYGKRSRPGDSAPGVDGSVPPIR